MLAIQYPWRYESVFEELCDFHVVLCSAITDTPIIQRGKPVWADVSDRVEVGRFGLGVTGIILPSFNDPARNLLNIPRNYVEGKLNIGLWQGEKKHLALMEEAADLVAIPYTVYGRSGYISREDAHKYHAYGFCNLDELRRYPYRSLHTSAPITAALLGIDLRTRERRPKNLPKFSYDLYLNEVQLELAYNNCVAIKEAMEYARRDNTSHT